MSQVVETDSIVAKESAGPIAWAENGWVPDYLIRAGIKRLNRLRLAEIQAYNPRASRADLEDFVEKMKTSEIALVPDLANDQHYEVPEEFFGLVMGRHRKYSSCYWTEETCSLDDAESEALRITCENAQIEDGMQILDLGCGWGSLSLWIASHYPNCQVVSVSNSNSQRRYINRQLREHGLNNVLVITEDMNRFDTALRFDRIVSVEMFEHMRNYEELYRRISGWLQPDGLFFKHIFCHRSCVYEFADNGPNDWMSRHFFSGGMMPSDDLPLHFQKHLRLRSQKRWPGTHYQKTANAWLENMDLKKAEIMPVLAKTYGPNAAEKWFQRWRIFFMACSELFAHDKGREWYVSHYLFERAKPTLRLVQP